MAVRPYWIATEQPSTSTPSCRLMTSWPSSGAATKVTPARMRSKLKAEGYGFAQAQRRVARHAAPGDGSNWCAVPAAPRSVPPATITARESLSKASWWMTVSVLAPTGQLLETTPGSTHVAAQLALIHQELVTLNGLLAAHICKHKKGSRPMDRRIAADSAW
jgi:hypothetical protein